MPSVKANGIQIEYDTFGDPSNRLLLLIAGFSLQMIAWDEEFCGELVDRGHYVIRFDNRDVGLSTKMDELGIPDLQKIVEARMKGEPVDPPYMYEDMADDAVGLLDALDIEKAHICGMSMGGAIAQTIAIRNLSRVLSLVPIYSPIGNPELPQPKPEVVMGLFSPAQKTAKEILNIQLIYLECLLEMGFLLRKAGRVKWWLNRTIDVFTHRESFVKPLRALVRITVNWRYTVCPLPLW